MYKKLLAFLLVILCILSTAVIGVSAADTELGTNVIYFRVPDSWNNCHRIYCHIYILDTGVAFTNWQSKKEQCTQVEDNLYVYDLSKASIEIMDECAVIFSSDTGQQTYPLMLRYDGLGATAYCDGTIYENVADYSKTVSAAFWENKNPEDVGPIMMISSIGNVVGTCKSQWDQTTEEMFESFLRYDLYTAQKMSGKTDQQLIDDIITPLGISEFTADKIIRKVGDLTLDWGEGYGNIERPYNEWTYDVVDGEIILTGFNTNEKEVNIPDIIDGMPVTGIESSSFFRILFMESKVINIPASVTNISVPVIDDSFTTDISAFNVHKDNPAYSSVEGVLYSKDKTTLVSYPTDKKDKVCTVDEATVNICDYAFIGASFEEIILPDSLENIPANAFYSCVWLKELNIPASVTYIDCDAFKQNRSLTAVNVSPENENYCSVDGVLYSKDKTEMLYFPIAKSDTSYTVLAGVTKIGKRAFQAFSNLDCIYLPDSVETIAYRAFYGCGADVNIPANVKVIEEEAFAASGITEIIIPEGITEIGYRAFFSANAKIITLPQGLTTIGYEAFSNNNDVTSIIIPDTVSTIDEYAFSSCSSLDEITIPDSVTYIGESAFSYHSEKLTIFGSEGSAAEKYATENNIRFVDLSKCVTGDVNLDGEVNIKDATAIQKHLAAINIFSSKAETLADYDGDGTITIKDATSIQKFIAGIL